MKNIHSIEIMYKDGQKIYVTANDIERIEALEEAVSLLERAREVYHRLEPLFNKQEKK